ncbi:MAG: imidazole glycerol phosphate synthase subunit HisH [Parvularculales bacterium]
MNDISVAIIDYGSGNLHSAAKAFERVAHEQGVGGAVQVIAKPEDVLRATRIVLPGVGAFGDCQTGLSQYEGMIEALTESVVKAGRPFLGICVGMQLMATHSHEHGRRHDGFGWLPGDVIALDPQDSQVSPKPKKESIALPVKVPHMGWNNLRILNGHPVLEGLDNTNFYFAHSYHLKPASSKHLLAEVDHGRRVTAVAGRDNIIGLQCHPEKSQHAGLRLIHNFLRWTP